MTNIREIEWEVSRELEELDAANSKVANLMQYITEHGLPLPEDK
jgi:hypothetical protein